MILNKPECQKIVDRVISILGKNINIINSEGIIIASGDKSHVNSFHKGAKLAAFEKKEVIVEDKDLNSYEGCRKGVNLPIYHNDEVLGVVGITGEPSENCICKRNQIITQQLRFYRNSLLSIKYNLEVTI